jgi:hypothetical protein
MLNAGQTTIYTVPTGKRCVLHALGIGGGCRNNRLEHRAKGTTTDFLPVQNLDNGNAQYDVLLLMPVPSATPAIAQNHMQPEQ